MRKVRKIVAKILVLSIVLNLLTGGVVQAAEAGALALTVETVNNVSRGDEVTVSVVASEAENIGAMTVRIGYDETALEYVSHQGNNLPNGDGANMVHNSASNWIQYSVTSSMEAWSSDDGMTLFTMTFKVLDSASGLSSLEINTSNLVVSTYNYDTVVPTIVNGGVNVVVPLTGIQLDNTSVSITNVETKQLAVITTPSDATDVTSTTWKSSNTSVATVDANGLVSAVSSGTTTITAQIGSYTASCAVTVTSPLTGISFEDSAVTLKQGASTDLVVQYTPEDTTDAKDVVWSTSDATIATVNNGTIAGVGEGSATITAKVGSFSAECVVTVEKTTITEDMISGITEDMNVEYTGTAITPEITVKDGTTDLVENTDYTLKYSNNVDKGTASVVIEGIVNYKGTITKEFNIVANVLEESMVAEIESVTYTGSGITPSVEVKDGNKVLVEDTDYTVSYENNVNVGTANVTIKGQNNYAETLNTTFEITAKSIATASVSDIDNVTYNRMAQVPTPTVMDNQTTLVLGQDYTLSYEANTNAGEAKVIVIGKGNYTGETSKTFVIEKADAPTITFPTVDEVTYGTSLAQVALNGTSEYGTFEWKDEAVVPEVGTNNYTVLFVANDDTVMNYETIASAEAELAVTVNQATPSVDVVGTVTGLNGARELTLTATAGAVGAGSNPTGEVTFINGAVEIATVELSNGVAELVLDVDDDTEYEITAIYAGDNNYKEASDVITVDTTKKTQSITFEEIGTITYGDDSFALALEGVLGSGAITYISSNEDVISIKDDSVTIGNAGEAVITAVIGEDDDYQSATTQVTVVVNKKEVTFKAVNETVRRGETMPEFTYDVVGLVNGDEVVQAPELVSSTLETKTQGVYDISFSTEADIANANNYIVKYENAKLTVEAGFTVSFVESDGTEIVTITDVLYGDTVEAGADPIKENNTFEGWYVDKTYEEEFDFSTEIIADTVIYAKFTEDVAADTEDSGNPEVNVESDDTDDTTATTDDTAATGDTSNLYVFMLLLVLASMGIVVVVKKRTKYMK